MSLTLLLHHNILGFQLTYEAKLISELIEKSARTVQELFCAMVITFQTHSKRNINAKETNLKNKELTSV